MLIDANPVLTALIIAGLLAPLGYAVTVLAGAGTRPGYSHLANAISELVQTRAPHRSQLNLAFLVYNLLTIAFGIGVASAAASNGVALSGWLVAATGVLGIVMTWFPMDPIGSKATFEGVTHLVIAGLMSVGSMAAILSFAIGSASLPDWHAFSGFSYVMFGYVLVSGAVAAWTARGHAPLMGLYERLTIGGYLVWQAAVAFRFLVS